MYLKLAALAALAATSALAAPTPAHAPRDYHPDPFANDPNPHIVRYFQTPNMDPNAACEQLKYQNWVRYQYDAPGNTVRGDCKVIDAVNHIIAAYATQFRSNGGPWSETGPLGDALGFHALTDSNGLCNQVAPGFCDDAAGYHPEQQLYGGGPVRRQWWDGYDGPEDYSPGLHVEYDGPGLVPGSHVHYDSGSDGDGYGDGEGWHPQEEQDAWHLGEHRPQVGAPW